MARHVLVGFKSHRKMSQIAFLKAISDFVLVPGATWLQELA